MCCSKSEMFKYIIIVVLQRAAASSPVLCFHSRLVPVNGFDHVYGFHCGKLQRESIIGQGATGSGSKSHSTQCSPVYGSTLFEFWQLHHRIEEMARRPATIASQRWARFDMRDTSSSLLTHKFLLQMQLFIKAKKALCKLIVRPLCKSLVHLLYRIVSYACVCVSGICIFRIYF